MPADGQSALDMDSSVSETYGQQEDAMYNGDFACECYHPLFVSNALGKKGGTGVVFGAGLSPSIPVRSKRLELGFRVAGEVSG